MQDFILKAYIEGFAEKCAEYNVDPSALIKFAARGDYIARFINSLGNKMLSQEIINAVPNTQRTLHKALGYALSDSKIKDIVRNYVQQVSPINMRTPELFAALKNRKNLMASSAEEFLKNLKNLNIINYSV